jgi:hypothetical protein
MMRNTMEKVHFFTFPMVKNALSIFLDYVSGGVFERILFYPPLQTTKLYQFYICSGQFFCLLVIKNLARQTSCVRGKHPYPMFFLHFLRVVFSVFLVFTRPSLGRAWRTLGGIKDKKILHLPILQVLPKSPCTSNVQWFKVEISFYFFQNPNPNLPYLTLTYPNLP